MRKVFILILACCWLAACELNPTVSTVGKADFAAAHPQQMSATQQRTYSKLLEHYQNWQGTPYALGGNSKSGVDCSGFVQLTYQQIMHTPLPRSTNLQVHVGKKIAFNQLQIGDLIFFKPAGKKYRHVGIYMGNGKFMHASTSRGVIISNLGSSYWQNSYWQARRVGE